MNRVIYGTFGAYYLLDMGPETGMGGMILQDDQQGTPDTCGNSLPMHGRYVYDVIEVKSSGGVRQPALYHVT